MKKAKECAYLACWLAFTFPTTSVSWNEERNFDTHEALLSLSDTHSLIVASPVKIKMLIVYSTNLLDMVEFNTNNILEPQI